MDIGIIGSGMIGGTLARRFAAVGHRVTIANSRGPQSLAGLVAEIGDQAHAATADGAAVAGPVVVVAIPMGRYRELPAHQLAGKVVVDANNYYPGRDGSIPELDAGAVTSSELLAASLDGARVVKAFNTIYFRRIREAARPPGAEDRLAIPVAGDDAGAKQTVCELIDDMGFDAVDAGTLRDGLRQQPGTPVYNQPLDAAGVRRALEAQPRRSP